MTLFASIYYTTKLSMNAQHTYIRYSTYQYDLPVSATVETTLELLHHTFTVEQTGWVDLLGWGRGSCWLTPPFVFRVRCTPVCTLYKSYSPPSIQLLLLARLSQLLEAQYETWTLEYGCSSLRIPTCINECGLDESAITGMRWSYAHSSEQATDA